MKVSAMLKHGPPTVSFEFFPPKTDEGLKNLMETVATLKELSPSYVTMTYGAGGSTRGKTVELVSKIKHDIGIETVAHLTCVGHSREELQSVLSELADKGIENVLALRGDPPKGQSSFVPAKDGFAHATDLVRLIRSNFKFCVGAAGYPEKHIESPSMDEDLRHLKTKVDAGADFIVTQLFFRNEDYFSFVERLRALNVNVPVVAGIMPITDFDQIQRFASMCGARLPAELVKKLQAAGGDKEKTERIGIDHAAAQCEELLRRGAPGLHLYTLNKSRATREIFVQLKQKKVIS